MDSKLLNLRLQAERRTVQPDHDLMLWAHDEIKMLRSALVAITCASSAPVMAGIALSALRETDGQSVRE